MEPFIEIKVEEEVPSLLSPVRTMISIGASACNKTSLEETEERRKRDTHTDLAERLNEYSTSVRRGKSEEE